MGISRTLTNWNVQQQPLEDAFWGPVTASIDWCEGNYDVSRWIAEFVNTLSNMPVIAMASYGIYSSYSNGLPNYLLLPFVGLAMISTGSTFFHATLSYHTQLMDELPMLFAATFMLYCTYSTQKPGQKQPIPWVGFWLALFVSGICLAYLVHPDPVLHQAAFAVIVLNCVGRSTYLAKTCFNGNPADQRRSKEIVHAQCIGIFFLLSAFGIWLVDCFACGSLTRLKYIVGKPLSFLLELHAWWHLGTGIGGYWLSITLQMLVLSVQQNSQDWEFTSGWFPVVRRSPHSSRMKKVT